MKIAVAGIGYVGLSVAVLLSQHHEVIAYDIQEDRIDKVNRGKSPVQDKELIWYLENKRLRLRATGTAQEAFTAADYVIVSTPTNYDSERNYFDTSSVEQVIEQALKLSPEAVIVIKSTVPAGFTQMISEKFQTDRILFSPEFLREGHALYDNLWPSRIVVGSLSGREPCERARAFARLLQEGALKEKIPVLYTGATEAEAIKLFSNTYLAMRIAFFNELDTYAESKKLDTKQIISGVCLDARIGDFYNNPSFGYGGYCLPKDTRQMVANFQDVPNKIMSAIVEANRTRMEYIAGKILESKPGVVGIYRLLMKTDSDNFRKSSIQGVMRHLKQAGVPLLLYEPLLDTAEYEGIPVVNDFSEFQARADILVANRWTEELETVREKVYTRDLYERD